MRRIIFFLSAATLWAAPNQATLGSTNKGVISNLPTSPPFSNVATWHIDWRITIPSSAATGWSGFSQSFLSINSFSGYRVLPYIISAGSSYSYLVNTGQDGTGVQFSCPTINFGQDTVFRLQKNTTNLTCESWNVDGSNYQLTTSGTFNGTTPGLRGTFQLGDAVHSEGDLAFLRGYSGAVALTSKPPFGGSGGDLWDYEFNNNLNDSSGNGLTLTRTGTFFYSLAATYAPACLLPAQMTFRAGQPITGLTGLNSFPLNGSSTLNYTWQQVSGNNTVIPPSLLSWSNQTAASPVLSGSIAGSYSLQLTVTDSSGQSSTCSTKYGVVATDANGSVIISNPVHAKILGPMIAASSNPWPQYEVTAQNFLQLLIKKINGTSPYDYFFIDYWNQPLAGTVTVTNGSSAVVGSGTTFTTTFCQGPGNPSVPKNVNSTNIVVWYPIHPSFGLPAGVTGRRFGTVISCSDDTHLTASFANNGTWQSDTYILAGSGLSYAYVEQNKGMSSPVGVGGWGQPGSSIPGNYYDNVMALYAEYYRTGIDDYLVAARTLADRWFSYPGYDKGLTYESSSGALWSNQVWPNRSLAMTGLFLRATDNPPFDYWPGIRAAINFLIGVGTPAGTSAYGSHNCAIVGPALPFAGNNISPTFCIQDVRENGYGMLYVAYDALFDPNPSQAAAAAAALSRDMTNRWTLSGPAPWLQSDNLAGQYAAWNTGGASFTANVSAGGAVTAQAGNTWNPAQFNPPGAGYVCNANTPNMIWFNPNGTTVPVKNSDGESVAYYVVYVNPTALQLVNCTGANVPYNGTPGSGKGWEITNSLLGYGNQPFMTGILNRAFYFVNMALASSDPTNAANASAYALQNSIWMATTGLDMGKQGGFTAPIEGLFYGRVFINCEPPSFFWGCVSPDGGFYAQRTLDAEGLNAATSAFLLNPSSAFTKTLGDLMMSAMFSVPGDGSTPGFDGYNLVSTLDINNFFYTSTTQHKYVGFFFGIGGGWNWPSARLGGLMPLSPRVVQVSLNFQTASQAVLTVTRPDGSSSQVTCTSSPCPVTIDARQGDHLLSIKYLDVGSHVLIPPQQTIVKAR